MAVNPVASARSLSVSPYSYERKEETEYQNENERKESENAYDNDDKIKNSNRNGKVISVNNSNISTISSPDNTELVVEEDEDNDDLTFGDLQATEDEADDDDDEDFDLQFQQHFHLPEIKKKETKAAVKINSPISNTSSTAPFPWVMVLVLASMNLNEAFQQNVIWPFIPMMIHDFKIGKSKEEDGLYIGILASTYFIAQLICSVPWGVASDKYGRRPILILGSLGTTLSTLVFGFAKIYPVAIVGRFLAGFLSGNIGVSKTYLSESVPKVHSAYGMSMLGLSYGIGSIFGPIVGGLLSRPVEQYGDNYPNLFPSSSLFATYPYLLPELISAGVGLLGLFFSIKYLPESPAFVARAEGEKEKRKREEGEHIRPVEKGKGRGIIQSIRGRQTAKGKTKFQRVDEESEENEYGMKDLVLEDGQFDDSLEMTIISPVNATPARTPTASQLSSPVNRPTLPPLHHQTSTTELINHQIDTPSSTTHQSSSLSSSPFAHASTSSQSSPPSICNVMQQRQVIFTTGAYGILALMFILYDELFPILFEASMEDQGLGYTMGETGGFLAIAGGTLIIYQMGIFPHIVDKVGPRTLFRVSLLVLIPYFAWFPALYNLIMWAGKDSAVAYIVLSISALFRSVLAASTFTPIFLLIGTSAPASALGSVNGLGQSFAAAARSIGPVLGGGMWSYSLTWHKWWHGFVVYSIIAMLSLVNFIVSLGLSEGVNESEEEAEKAHHIMVGIE